MITTPCTLLSPSYTPFELTGALRLSKPTHLFVQPQFLTYVQRVAKDVGFPDSHIYILEGEVKGRLSFGKETDPSSQEPIHFKTSCASCWKRYFSPSHFLKRNKWPSEGLATFQSFHAFAPFTQKLGCTCSCHDFTWQSPVPYYSRL